MKVTARDLMSTNFHTLSPEMSITEAVHLFGRASREESRKIFGLMVLNADGKLVGMLSMYDILLFMRPKHIHIWGMMEDIDIEGITESACQKAEAIQVGDIMSSEVVTIGPRAHKFMVLDIMIKKHIRRLPVVENDRLLGIVYISDLFYDVLDRFAGNGG